MKCIVFIKVSDDSAQEAYASFSEPHKAKGAFLYRFHGDQLRVDGRFLLVRLSHPTKHEGMTVWIPQEHVFLVVAGAQEQNIGFLNG
jgi:hypothetical protein